MSCGPRSNPVARERVGQTGIGVAGDGYVRLLGELFQERYIRSGPSEQLSPTDSGFTCFTAFQNASVVWAEMMVSPPRPTAAEIMTGSSDAVLVEDFPDGDQRGLGVERVEDGFDQQQV